MSDLVANQRNYVFFKRGIASLVLIFAFGFFLAPQAAFALETTGSETEPTTQVEAPILPATCAALCTPPTTPETPETPETPDVPEVPVWSPLALTTVAVTNNPSLNWSWSVPTSPTPGATYGGYGFALYNGDTVLASGTLGADVQQYSYAAPATGTYRLFVWILDTTGVSAPAPPAVAGCEYRDTTLDTAAPVIVVNGEGFTSNGNITTPTFTTTETDLIYSWVVNADGAAVTISNSAELTPMFTFLKDGTYQFTLTATDALGNITTTTLVITYIKPYIPAPQDPLPPVVLAPVTPYVPPAVVLAQAQRTVAVGAGYEAAVASTDVMTESTPATQNTTNASANKQDPSAAAVTTAQVVQSSSQGWLFVGVPWYWWVIGILIIVSAVQWYRSGVFRKRPDDI